MRYLRTVLLVVAVLAAGAYGSSQGDDFDLVRFDDDFREPPVWRSQGGVLERALEIRRAPNVLRGRPISTLTYAGGIPGPTLRVKPGDRLKIRLVNNATLSASVPAASPHRHATHPTPFARHQAEVEAGAIVAGESAATLLTNLHTHGLQVDPRGNGDNPFISIEPGQYFDYDIPIPVNQPAGLHWYHPHRHMAVSRQLWNGLAGAILVEGGLDTVPEIAAAQDRILVVNELLLDELGQVPASPLVPTAGPVPFYGLPPVPTDIHLAINGVLRPRMTIRPDEIQRWRILNAGAHRFLNLALEDAEGRRISVHQIAQDGINFGVSLERETILMAPGNRIEILVRVERRGLYTLKALAYDQGHPGGPRPELLLAKLVAHGRPQRTAVAFPLPLIAPQQGDLSTSPADVVQPAMQWSGQIMTLPLTFELDGQLFDENRVDRAVTVGTIEEWTLDNHDVFQHPFHIHVNPFQVLKVDGVDYPQPFIWWDVFALPRQGSVTVRMAFRPDVIGKTVYHCHIIPHEDTGMMGVIDLMPPPPIVPPTVPVNGPYTQGPVRPPPPPQFSFLDRPYVFTQLANRGMATVGVGRRIVLQLPGDPTTWTVTVNGRSIEPLGSAFVPSVGQFDGASGIYEFEFGVRRSGVAHIRAVAEPELPWFQPNPFELHLLAVLPHPQAAALGPGVFPLVPYPHTSLDLPTLLGIKAMTGNVKGMTISRRTVDRTHVR
ncbi:MAG: multicopper oxidase domain-containing protein [Candidatus Rokuibacteriota bacterium]